MFAIDGKSPLLYRFADEIRKCKICDENVNKIEHFDVVDPWEDEDKKGWIDLYPAKKDDEKYEYGCIYCQISHSEVDLYGGVVRACTNCIHFGYFTPDESGSFFHSKCGNCSLGPDYIIGDKVKDLKRGETMDHVQTQEKEARKRFHWNSQIKAMQTFLLIGRFRRLESVVLVNTPREIIKMIAEKVGEM